MAALISSFVGRSFSSNSSVIRCTDKGSPAAKAKLKSKDRLLIGFATSGHVGIDLEPAGRRARNPLGVAHRYFSAAESGALAVMDQAVLDQAFMRAWACKEAVVKASGEGIANQLCRFTVEIDPDLPPAILDFENEDAGQWSLALLQPEPGFQGAVAMNHEDMRVTAYRLLPAGLQIPDPW